MIPKTRIDKIKCFKEVKAIGQEWMNADRKGKDKVCRDLVELQRPKATIYPALVHRYIVKEQGFSEASFFVQNLMQYTCK